MYDLRKNTEVVGPVALTQTFAITIGKVTTSDHVRFGSKSIPEPEYLPCKPEKDTYQKRNKSCCEILRKGPIVQQV